MFVESGRFSRYYILASYYRAIVGQKSGFDECIDDQDAYDDVAPDNKRG